MEVRFSEQHTTTTNRAKQTRTRAPNPPFPRTDATLSDTDRSFRANISPPLATYLKRFRQPIELITAPIEALFVDHLIAFATRTGHHPEKQLATPENFDPSIFRNYARRPFIQRGHEPIDGIQARRRDHFLTTRQLGNEIDGK